MVSLWLCSDKQFEEAEKETRAFRRKHEKGILDVSALPNVVTRSDSTLDFSYLAP